jgi:hypothetical protein
VSEQYGSGRFGFGMREYLFARGDDAFQFDWQVGIQLSGATGARFTMASQIIAELSPRKGNAPVVISYITAPNEKKSVRASSFSSPQVLR